MTEINWEKKETSIIKFPRVNIIEDSQITSQIDNISDKIESVLDKKKAFHKLIKQIETIIPEFYQNNTELSPKNIEQTIEKAIINKECRLEYSLIFSNNEKYEWLTMMGKLDTNDDSCLHFSILFHIKPSFIKTLSQRLDHKFQSEETINNPLLNRIALHTLEPDTIILTNPENQFNRSLSYNKS